MRKEIQDFVKELRKGIKNGSWSNDRILRQFNDVYKAGYDHGCLDTYKAASQRIQETVNANQVTHTSDHVDGVELQSGSTLSSGGAGTNADNSYCGEGSTGDVSAARLPEPAGPVDEHPLFDAPVV